MIRLFGAVEWAAGDDVPGENAFALGQLDLFVNAALTERTSVLAEFVLEESTETRVVTDLERLQLTFRLNDHLQISAGRYHTGIGFYNAVFHHGALFETAIGRPRIFAFEDNGGVLPIHDVGLTARGTVPGTGSSLHYVAELGNGRAWMEGGGDGRPGDVNKAKAFNVGLALRPERLRGLEVGGSFYRDVIPGQHNAAVDHYIGAAYTVYRTAATELMAEWLLLAHEPRGGSGYRNGAGYLQLSHAWHIWRPFYRYDHVAVGAGTPIVGRDAAYRGHLAGMRIDPVPSIGFKAQYERWELGDAGPEHGLRTQLVFVF
jgi:hypothetical protein